MHHPQLSVIAFRPHNALRTDLLLAQPLHQVPNRRALRTHDISTAHSKRAISHNEREISHSTNALVCSPTTKRADSRRVTQFTVGKCRRSAFCRVDVVARFQLQQQRRIRRQLQRSTRHCRAMWKGRLSEVVSATFLVTLSGVNTEVDSSVNALFLIAERANEARI